MHKYIVLFFSATLFLQACKPSGPDKKVLNREQMISVLIDLHIADGGMYSTLSVNPDTLYKYGTARYLALFKKHHIDSSTFRRSVRYYAGKPVELEAMYGDILKRLAAKTDSANKLLLKSNNGPRPKAE